MNKKPNIVRPIGAKPAPLSEAEKIAAISRGFTQQYQSIAQGVLFNLIHGYATCDGALPKAEVVIEQTLSVTDQFMEKVGPACDASFAKLFNKPEEKKEEE